MGVWGLGFVVWGLGIGVRFQGLRGFRFGVLSFSESGFGGQGLGFGVKLQV